jgi:hypothetical protein
MWARPPTGSRLPPWHIAIRDADSLDVSVGRKSPRLRLANTDGFGFRIEYDLCFAAFELADDVRHLILERKFFFSIVRTLTKYVRLDDGVQQVRRQLGIRNHDRRGNFVVHLRARPACEPGIEMPGERIAIRLSERRRTTADIAAGAHRVHKIAHGENSADGIRRVALTARIERFPTFGNHLGGERDVGGDDQISGGYALDDLPIGHVESGGYLNGTQARDAGDLQRLIGNQRHANPSALSGAE